MLTSYHISLSKDAFSIFISLSIYAIYVCDFIYMVFPCLRVIWRHDNPLPQNPLVWYFLKDKNIYVYNYNTVIKIMK